MMHRSVISAFLSTPSGWRATDSCRCIQNCLQFLSTPSGWRATAEALNPTSFPSIYFYPRPPGGGRPYPAFIHRDFLRFLSTPSGWRATFSAIFLRSVAVLFLSTPSGWRATPAPFGNISAAAQISIHALRVEGDGRSGCPAHITHYFYPRPPGGGRRTSSCNTGSRRMRFLSTPSGWRATWLCWLRDVHRKSHFYPRPPGGGRHRCRHRRPALCPDFYPRPPGGGRLPAGANGALRMRFLSTPSGWRATTIVGQQQEIKQFLSTPSGWRATGPGLGDIINAFMISIHALRVEGDSRTATSPTWRPISIHALRVEGDWLYWYCSWPHCISIHALRVEGDAKKDTAP